MYKLIPLVLVFLSLLLLMPVVVLLTEIIAATYPRRMNTHSSIARPRVAILMPAHNEELNIANNVAAIRGQLLGTDRFVVVADNCTDETANLARAAGAHVIERKNPDLRGKGYALDFGIRHLETDAPEIVIIMDADCQASPGTLDTLSRTCKGMQRPVQALYLMRSPIGTTTLKSRVAEFAWVIKNHARPLGLRNLGLPCQLMGTGMAFPWTTIRAARLATSHIVEDLSLGIELARCGVAPAFCPDALITSHFPTSSSGTNVQRTRWEHGHLSVILNDGPRLFASAIAALDKNLLALTIDLCVPPLALLALLTGSLLAASSALFLVTNVNLPLLVASVCALTFALSIIISWAAFGRKILTFGELILAPFYPIQKIPLYIRFLIAEQKEWVRSKRDGD
jgi:cellulose synthase/poly-beta-1,6-N-acetylglucosamine synthase-like glycosyltransferase